jgi:hypothetical protein
LHQILPNDHLEGHETGIVGEDNRRTAFGDSGHGSKNLTAPHVAKNLLAVKLVPKKLLKCISWKQLLVGAPITADSCNLLTYPIHALFVLSCCFKFVGGKWYWHS